MPCPTCGGSKLVAKFAPSEPRKPGRYLGTEPCPTCAGEPAATPEPVAPFTPEMTSVVTKIKHLYRSGSKMQRGQVRAWMRRVLSDEDGAR